jgi:hypothetical protein
MNLPRDCAGTSPSRSTVAARSTWCAIDECPPLALTAGRACPGLAGGSPRRRTSLKSGGRSAKAKTMTPAARGHPTSPFNRAPPRRCLLQASRRLLPSYLPSPSSSLPDLPERCLALCYPRLPSNPPRALRSLLNRRLHPYQLSTRSLLVAPTEPRVLLTVALPAVPLSFWSPLILPETQVEISPKHPLLWSVLSFLFPSPTPQNCLHPRCGDRTQVTVSARTWVTGPSHSEGPPSAPAWANAMEGPVRRERPRRIRAEGSRA